MTKEVVNYSQQINEAHKACLAAKELGGKKAHECGTWLLKQKEVVPYGQWIKWVEANCSFHRDTAHSYMAIAKLDVGRVRQLSMRDALWEVAQQKAEEAEIDEEITRDKANGKPTYKPRPGTKGEALFEEIRQRSEQEKKHREYLSSLSEDERTAYRQAEEDQRVAAKALLKDLKGVAEEIVKAGYRELSKRYHPDMGGNSEDMRKLVDAKKELDYLVQTKWRKS